MKVQILSDAKGKPTHVVLAYADYLLLSGDEDAEDEVLGRIVDERRGEETLPDAVVARLLDRENPLKVIREHRGMTQAKLADAVDSTTPYISQLETGARTPSLDLLTRLSKVLRVPVDLLVPKGTTSSRASHVRY